MTLLSLLKIIHIWGLVMGLGGAVMADLLILRHGILRPVRRATILQAWRLSHIVFAGLALLWISGAALVAVRAGADPVFLTNQKLWAKTVIVAMLTVNGIVVHRFALPALAGGVGRRLFDRVPPRKIALLTLIAAISSVSWIAPFVLGVASELNFKTPAILILGLYGILVFLAWATFCGFALLLPRLRRSWQQGFAAGEVSLHQSITVK